MNSHDTATAQLEPIMRTTQRTKSYKSRKPADVQQAVITKASLGDTNSQIARDLGIARTTVASILSPAEISQHVEEIRSDFVLAGDLWKARKVMRQKLDKGSESAATTILRGFNVLQSNPKVEVNVLNVGAQAYAQRMQARELETETTISSVPTTSDDPSST